MPYIKQEDRVKIDRMVEAYFSTGQSTVVNAGELNYCISMICKKYLESKGLKYDNINEIIGVLECAKLEMYRRVASPYEDKKIQENGDI